MRLLGGGSEIMRKDRSEVEVGRIGCEVKEEERLCLRGHSSV